MFSSVSDKYFGTHDQDTRSMVLKVHEKLRTLNGGHWNLCKTTLDKCRQMVEMFGEHPTLEAFGLVFCVLNGGSTEALVHHQYIHYFSASS